MDVKRSITIDASPEVISKALADFKTWPAWSPWLIAEPDATLTYADDGSSYSWAGKRVGEGQMSIKHQGDHTIDYDLLFLKPWKSKADTGFSLKESSEGTNVTWTMKSKLPFFMFFMKKKMEAFVGNDYERGLAMLKDYIEKGQVHSKLDILGKQSFEGTKYIGIKRDTSIEGMKQHMGKDFGSLMQQAQAGNGHWFTIYHKFDFVNEKVSYTACVGVDDYPSDLDANIIQSEMPACSVHTVRHTGPYEHIGNAWATSMMMLRNKEFKPVKKYHPMEFYRNSPENTPPEQLISDISFVV